MKANWRRQFSLLSRSEQLCRRQWKRCGKRLVIQMRNLCSLGKSTWTLTEICCCNRAEKLSKKEGKNWFFLSWFLGIWHCYLHCTCRTVAKSKIQVRWLPRSEKLVPPGDGSFFLVCRNAMNSKMPHHNKQEKLNSVCIHTQYAVKMSWILP